MVTAAVKARESGHKRQASKQRKTSQKPDFSEPCHFSLKMLKSLGSRLFPIQNLQIEQQRCGGSIELPVNYMIMRKCDLVYVSL